MTIAIGYKLVRQHPRYESLMARGRYSLTYTPGAKVYKIPDTYGIMIFKAIKYAICCQVRTGRASLCLEVEYDTDRVIVPPTVAAVTSESTIELFYTDRIRFSKWHITMSPPSGTLAVPWVDVLNTIAL